MPTWNRIKVVGVGGAGSNAVNNMIASQMEVIHLRFQLTIANAIKKTFQIWCFTSKQGCGIPRRKH
jgi:cell division GTPase FtsZ